MAAPIAIAEASRGFTEVTGAFGVGSFGLLALFLVLDATTQVYFLVENISRSASWALFVAPPLLVSAYVGGVMAMALGREIRVLAFSSRDAEARRFAAVLNCEKQQLHDHFQSLLLRRAVLEGSAPVLVSLTPGLILKAEFWDAAVIGAVLSMVAVTAACAALVLAHRMTLDFDRAIELVRLSESATP